MFQVKNQDLLFLIVLMIMMRMYLYNSIYHRTNYYYFVK